MFFLLGLVCFLVIFKAMLTESAFFQMPKLVVGDK